MILGKASPSLKQPSLQKKSREIAAFVFYSCIL